MIGILIEYRKPEPDEEFQGWRLRAVKQYGAKVLMVVRPIPKGMEENIPYCSRLERQAIEELEDAIAEAGGWIG